MEPIFFNKIKKPVCKGKTIWGRVQLQGFSNVGKFVFNPNISLEKYMGRLASIVASYHVARIAGQVGFRKYNSCY